MSVAVEYLTMGYFILVFFLLVVDKVKGQDIEQFVCDRSGRFENPLDDTCKSFYLCSLTIQGDLVQTQFSCPDGSTFSPQYALCSRDYTCQRSFDYVHREIDIEKSGNVYYHCQDRTHSKFKCLRSGKFADLLDATCRSYHLCSLSRNGFYIETKLHCPEKTTFDPNTQKCHTQYQCPCDFMKSETVEEKTLNSQYLPKKKLDRLHTIRFPCVATDHMKKFECKKAGKFADERDVTCTDYYMCSKLSNGRYVKSFFSCPHGSVFDPIAKRCSTRYECSCQIETNPIESTTQKILPTSRQIITTTDFIPNNYSLMPNSCVTPKQNFVCKMIGRFSNNGDVSCSTYYLCNKGRRGELRRKVYRCPRCLYFNPELGKCTDDYVCPCNTTEVQEQTTENVSSRKTSPSTSTRNITDINVNCRIPSTSRPFKCTARGRFPDKRDTTCASYFLCIKVRRGIFRKTSHRCQRNLRFDPKIQRCCALYKCPCMQILTTTHANVTTISQTTSQRSTIPSEHLTSTQSTNTVESSNTTTIRSSSTTVDCRIPEIDRPFICAARGRFPDRRDPTCASYFQCTIVKTGSFRRNSHQCRNNSKFDPTLQKCSARYKCPCINIPTTTNMSTIRTTTKHSTITSEPITSTQSMDTTTGEPFTRTTQTISTTSQADTSTTTKSTQSTDTTASDLSSTRSTKTSTISSSTQGNTIQSSSITPSRSTGTPDVCRIPPINRPFRCTAKGRFSDRRDPTCASYFQCVIVRRGIFRRTSHRCPRSLRFNPTIQRCSARYLCPCINISTTSSANITISSRSTTQRSTSSSETTSTSQSIKTSTSEHPSTRTTITSSISSSPRGNTSTSSPISSQFTTTSSESPNITTSTSSIVSSTTQSSNITTSWSTGTTDDCSIPPNNRPFRCTARGRFPDRRDPSCASYFQCEIVRRGIFRRTSHRCRSSLKFEPTLQRCSTRYLCPCINISTTSSANMTTSSGSTTQRSTSSSEPTSTTLSTNTTTTELPSTRTTITSTTSSTTQGNTSTSSPISSQFTTTSSQSPNITTSTSSMVSSTTQSSNITTSWSIGTTDDCGIPPDNRPFRCTARGRFPDRRDPTCASYFQCVIVRRGIFRRTSHRCRSSLKFDPTLQKCSTRYLCPCINIPTTTSANITTTSRSTTQRSTSSSEPTSTSQSTNTSTRDLPSTRTTIISTISSSPQGNTNTSQFTTTSSESPNITTSTSSIVSSTTQSSNITTSWSTGTTDDCSIPPNNRPFRCTARGRFPDRRDPTCASYFQCVLVRRGIFRRTSHRCRSSLKFDPTLQRCSTRYLCPCINISTTTSANITTSSRSTTQRSTSSSEPTSTSQSTITSTSDLPSTRTTIISTISSSPQGNTSTSQFTTTSSESPNITTSTSSIVSSTTQSSNITTSWSTGTTDDCSIPPHNRPFRCAARGRYPDRRDPTCSSYFQCVIVRPGIFRRTSHRCRSSLKFDPTLQRCSTRYLCPCMNIPTTTSANITTSSRSTTQRSTSSSEPTSTSQSTNTSTSDLPSTRTTIISTISSSPQGNTSTSQFTTTSSESPNITTSTSSIVSSTTQSSNITTSWSTGTTDDCRIPPNNRPFRCTARGRFPDRRDPTCASYFQCVLVRRGIFRRTSHRCRSSLKFDPTLQRCSNRYLCPCINISTTTSANITTSSRSTTQGSTSSSEPTSTSQSTNTSTSDLPSTRTTIISTISSSPQGNTSTSQFTTTSSESPNITTSTSSIVSSTTQSSNITTSWSTGTTDDCSIPPHNRPFRCTARGRFPDRRDPTCASYFQCVLVRRGIFRRTSHRCRSSLKFDPTLQRCSSRYLCPCLNISTTTSANITTSSRSTTQRSTSSSEPTSTSQSTNTSTSDLPSTRTTIISTISSSPQGNTSTSQFTTTSSESPNITTFTPSIVSSTTQSSNITTSWSTGTTDDCSIPPNNRPFRCTARGRFPDRRDPTCASYFQCVLVRRGIFRRTSHRCRSSLKFDPTLQRCSTRYLCPCINISTTTSDNITTSSRSTTQRSTSSSEPTSTSQSTNTSTSDLPSTRTTIISTISSAPQGNTSTSQFTTTSSESPNITTSTSSIVSSTTQSSNITTSWSTGTTDDCSIPPHNRPFRCTARGRYPDRRDPTCASYFQCVLVRRGIFRRTSHRCRSSLKFDPTLQRCSSRYLCPCINISTTTSANITTSSRSTTQRSTSSSEPTSTSHSTNTSTSDLPSTRTTIISTISSSPQGNTSTSQFTTTTSESPNITTFTPSIVSSTTQSSNFTTSWSTGTTDDCSIPPNNRPFRCTTRGRFPDRRDTTCASYFQCVLVRRGIFRRISHRCRSSLKFDPTLQRCSTRYSCPCINISTTISANITTSSRSTTQRSTSSSEPTSTSQSTNTSTSDLPSTRTTIISTISSSPQGNTSTSQFTTTSSESPNITTSSSSIVSSTTQSSNITTSWSTGTTDDCSIPPHNRPFRCTARGRYPDRRDPTCASYFQCVLVRRGIFRRTSHRCRSSLKFDPTLQRCSSRYLCACINISTTTSANITTSSRSTTQRSTSSSEPTSTSQSTNTSTSDLPSTRTTIISTISSSPQGNTSTSQFTTTTSESPNITTFTPSIVSSTTQSSNITTSWSTGTTDDCSIPPNNRPFRCTARGRFPDRRDPTCASYFQCVLVRRGIFRRTSHRCRSSLKFDPTLQRCSTRYSCPCINISTTTSANITTSSRSTTQRSTISSGPTSTSQSTNTSTSDLPSTRTTIISTISSLPQGNTSTSQFTTTSSESPNITTSTSSIVSSTTQSSNITTSWSTGTIDDCGIPPNDRPFRCTARGRFPDRRDPTCSSYFQCVIVRPGIFRRTSHRCRSSLKFDPTLQRCSNRYLCPCINISTTTSANITTSSRSTTQRSTSSSEPTSTSQSTNTSTSDLPPTRTTIISTISSSPQGNTSTSQFTTTSSESPNITTSTSSIVSSTTQSSNITTSWSTGTTDDCSIPPHNRPFRCTARGRFPDRRDPTCASYFQCVLVRRGIFRRTSHRCRSSLKFDPTLQRCSSRYLCPCINISTTTSANITTSSRSTTQRSTSSSEPTSTSQSTNTSTSDLPSTRTTIISTISSSPQGNTSTSQFTTTTSESPNITTFTPSIVSSTTQSSNITTSWSTGTTDDCSIPPNNRPFRCTARGRFPDRRDPTCASYFQCVLVRRGIFRRTSHRCRSSLKFDPTLQRCSTRYSCPCINISTTTSANITTSSRSTTQRSTSSSEPTSTSQSTNTSTSDLPSTRTTIISTISSSPQGNTSTSQFTTTTSESPNITTFTPSIVSSTTQSSNITTSWSTGTTDDCSIPPNNRPFRCTARGRFPDRRDPTCASYFQCVLVRRGIFRRTSHRCRSSLKFDPTLQRCSTRYSCPCINISTTTSANITTSSRSTTQRSTISSEPTSTSQSTNTSTSDLPSTRTTIISTISSSPQGNTSTSQFTTTSSESPNITTFTPSIVSSTTQSSNITTSWSTGTTDDCSIPPNNRPFRCTARGRFPDRRDPTCSSYFQCVIVRPGIFRRTSHRCRSSLKFDPTLQRCSTRYLCPCINIPTTTSANITTSSRSTTQRSTSSSEPTSTSQSTNTSTSDLPPTRTTIISTISSSPQGNTSTSQFTTTSSESPNITTFTPSNVSSTTQSSNITTSWSTGTTDDCSIPPNNRPFRCTARGRFPDRRDPTCASYFQCVLVRRGKFRRTSHRCRSSLKFDPFLQRCSTRYLCPCINISTTTSANITTSSRSTTQRSTSSSEPTSTSQSTNTSTSDLPSTRTTIISTISSSPQGNTSTSQFTTTTSESPNITTFTPSIVSSTTQSSNITTSWSTGTTDDCSIPPNNRPFRCTARGRFPDRRDPTCASYFQCVLVRRGIFRRTSHRCRSSLKFDPTLQRCSTRYSCPCINISTTTSANITTSSRSTTQRSTSSSEPTSTSQSTNTSTSDLPSTRTTIISTISSSPQGNTSTSQFTTTTSESPNITTFTPSIVSSTTQSSNITTSWSTGTTDDCSIPPNNRPFRCTARGRFPDRRDPTCASYFQCVLVRRGIFRRTSHRCRSSLKFDPTLQRCSTRYSCPCINISTTTSANITTSSRSTTQRSTISSEPTSTSQSTNTSTSDLPSTRTTIISTISSSPQGNTSTSQFTTTSSESPNITTFTPSIVSSTTQSSNITTSWSTGTTDDCSIPPNNRPFRCTARGRFPDRRDPTCSSYFQCVIVRPGIFRRTSHRCRSSLKFDPTLQRCSTRYLCPCINIPTTTSANITTSSRSTTQRSTSSSEPTSTSQSTNTSTSDLPSTRTTIISTISSSPQGNTSTSQFTTTSSESPNITTFTPSIVSSTTQSSNITTSWSTGTTDDCSIPPNNRPFRCTARGRFPDRRDPTCSSYFQCVLVRRGKFRRTSHRCRSSLNFDPILQRCSTRYICPCINISTTTSANITTSSRSTIQRSTSSSEPTSTSQSTNTSTSDLPSTRTTINSTISSSPQGNTSTSQFTTTSSESPNITTSTSSIVSSTTQSSNITTSWSTGTTDDCGIPPNNRPFRCTARGRFPDRRDPTCASYFQCVLVRRGIFRRTSHRCRSSLKFDPTLQRCSTRYSCPCINISTTTSANITTSSRSTTQRSTSSSEPTSTSQSTNTSTSDLPSTRTTIISTISSSPQGNTSTSQLTTTSSESPNITTSTSSIVSSTTQSSNITTSWSTGTTDDCGIPPNNRPFRCTARGRFPDRRDPTCASYFQCVLVRRGIFRRTSHRCRSSLKFDPTLQRCSNRYLCPCINISTTTSANITTSSLSTTQRSTSSSEPTSTSQSTNTSTSDLPSTRTSIISTISSSPQGNTSTSQFTTTSSKSPNITTSTSSIVSSTTQSSNITTSWSTGTTDDCSIPPHNRPFRCTARGRFPDRRDPTCASYFQCVLVRRGIFRRTSHRCRSSLKFDPTLQRCSSRYLCPCINISTTTSANITTSSRSTTQRSTSSSEPTSTSQSFTPSIVSSTTQSSNITTSWSTGTTDDCSIPPNNRPFRCTARGRFPDRRDPTCASYFQCVLVRRGIFRRTFHRCRSSLKFDPTLQRCSTRYLCPCINISTTTSANITTSSRSTTQRSASSSEPTSTSQSTITSTSELPSTITTKTSSISSSPQGNTSTSHITTTSSESPNFTTSSSSIVSSTTQSSNITTSWSTGTTDDCGIPPNNRPFRCTARGRFPDRRDPTCSSYFLCTIVKRGSFRRNSHHCRKSLKFDPVSQRCSNRYICPCINTSITTSANATTISLPTSQVSTTSSELISSTQSMRTTTRRTSEVTTSIRTITTTTDKCIIPNPDYNFLCKAQGRFRDLREQTCTSYFLCSLINGTYVQSHYRCPTGSKFDPIIQKCTYAYNCPCDAIISTSTSSTSVTIAEECLPSQGKFICTEEGRFRNPTDLSCCTYYLCTSSGNGTMLQTEYSCPEGCKFDPSSKQCTEDYSCPCSVTESIESFTPPSFECDIPTEEFVCTSVGRFPNRQDVSCCNYILCSISKTGSFIKIDYSCPEGTTFDPERQRCSMSYQCPCNKTEISMN